MSREELDRKIEEARKRSEVLSQAEIDDNSGVRITTNPDKLEEKNEIDFYSVAKNIKRYIWCIYYC